MTPTWTEDDDLPEAPDLSAHEGALGAAVSRLQSTKDITFATKHIGGGYDRAEVDAFMEQVSEAIDEVRVALESERHELATLRAENAQLRTPANADLDQQIALGAVGLLSQAQLIADKAIADAEQYARDLVITARTQYREARERSASSDDDDASVTPSPAPAAPHGVSAPEIEYVRTYAQVAQIQLRSVLDALTEQVDRLGTLPNPAEVPEPPMPDDATASEDDAPDEEPDWTPPQPAMQRQTYISP